MTEQMIQKFLQETRLDASLDTQDSSEELTAEARHPSVEDADRFVTLPEPDLLPDVEVNFLEIIELRTSNRTYTDESITLRQLSMLLWCTQGVKMVLPNGKSIRNVPSAGACHSLETYILLRHVTGIAAGLYRFLPFHHALLFLKDLDDVSEPFFESFPKKERQMAETAAAVFCWTSVFSRVSQSFGPRALRYVFLDAGHVGQNLYLAAQSLHLGICTIGAFDDKALSHALGIDGLGEFPVYVASLGAL